MSFSADLAGSLSPDDFAVQIWSLTSDSVISDIVSQGFDIIMSNEDAVYLDCGTGNWAEKISSHCDPFKQWRDIYDFRPRETFLALPAADPGRLGQILGSEAAMWSEYNSKDSLLPRIFPRLSALAERLWTDPVEGWENAERRYSVRNCICISFYS